MREILFRGFHPDERGERAMNKQEQIEKMAKAINETTFSGDGFVIGRRKKGTLEIEDKTDSRLVAKWLIERGYINGADFVEWMKSKYDHWKGVAISVRIDDIEDLLQEYLKGHREYTCCMAIQTEYEGECPYKEGR